MAVDLWVTGAELTCAGAATDPQKTEAAQVASELLYVLSGRQFDTRAVTVRPNRSVPDCECGPASRIAAAPAGVLLGSGCGCCSPELVLAGPVIAVTSVKVDGAAVDPAGFAVFDGHRLVRLGGLSWPCCQDLTRLSSQTGTFEVAYTWGKPSSDWSAAKAAARELGCELAKAAAGIACNLPKRTTSVSRQGVSFSLPDLMEFLKDGRTGIYLVDLFLKAVNPGGVTRRATFVSPDYPPRGATL